MMLWRNLNLAHKSGTILVVTLNIHTDVLTVIQEIDMFNIVSVYLNDVVLGNNLLKEELQKA